MRVLVLLSLIGLSACASGKTDPGAIHPTSQPIFVGSKNRTAIANVANKTTIAVPLDRVWAALPAAYDSLGLALTILDSKQHLIGNQGIKLRQKLGKVMLSKYIDCGSAQIGLSADSYDVFLSVVTTVRPTASGATEMVTMLESAARPMTFSQEYRLCTTTNLLENRLAELVKKALLR